MTTTTHIPKGYCHCGCGEKTKIATDTVARYGWVKGEPRAYLRGHRRAVSSAPYAVEARGYETPCWIWQRTIVRHGYGVLRRGGKVRYAHRHYYEQAKGPIPEGLELDHLCRNRACVNPDHLEPVTRAENLRRGEGPSASNARRTHCKRGHALSGDNVYVVQTSARKNPKRVCKTCAELRRAAAKAGVSVEEVA